MVQKEVKKKTSIYALAAVLSALVLVSVVYEVGTYPSASHMAQLPNVSGMKTFASADALKDYLGSTATNNIPQPYWARPSAPAPTETGTFGLSNALAPTNDYSSTNIQVAGVDEADTVKTDGQYIYTISTMQPQGLFIPYMPSYSYSSQTANNVYIIAADSQNAHVVSKIVLDNESSPQGLFLSPDSSRLVVLESKYQYQNLVPSGSGVATIMPYFSTEFTSIYVYDISNKADPILARNFTVSGNYFNSRMIGNYVYAVTSQSAYVYNGVVPVPSVYEGNQAFAASPTTIYYADMNQSSSYSFTSFYGLNVADDQQQPTNMTVLMSGASTMYVSPDNIYVAYPNWVNGTDLTAIYRVKISGLQLTLEAQGSVPGYTINQYAIDENNGYLRIATNLWQYSESNVMGVEQSAQINNVYVLDQSLSIVGKLENLAQGENLHAVRFMGDRCYLVTFMQTDPLFVIDLSQPTNPQVLGELKIPGYSDYLYPYDETHLIGVGKDATSAEQGNFAWYQGLKLSLFDVGDVNHPVQLSNYTIGDRGTDSPVLNDPKAFLFDKSKNLLVIPVSLALVSDADKSQGASAYGQTVWQGAYVFSVSVDGGFVLKGTVTHLNSTLLNSQGYLNNSYDYYSTQNQWITRALYIGNTLYTVSNAEVKLNSLTDLSSIATVNLS